MPFTILRHPLSRSYGVNLPSSLTRVFPRALGFSPHPPVSVYGTGTFVLTRGFSWQCGISHFATYSSLAFASHLYGQTDLPARPDYLLRHALPTACLTYPTASPHCSNGLRWYWNLNQLSIAYAFLPRLRSRLTLSGRAFLRNPWVFGGQDSHLSFRYSYRHYLFLAVHGSLRYRFCPLGTLPYP